MQGFFPLGFLPLGAFVDDGVHGEMAESALELDAADAALIWMIEIDAIDLEADA